MFSGQPKTAKVDTRYDPNYPHSNAIIRMGILFSNSFYNSLLVYSESLMKLDNALINADAYVMLLMIYKMYIIVRSHDLLRS